MCYVYAHVSVGRIAVSEDTFGVVLGRLLDFFFFDDFFTFNKASAAVLALLLAFRTSCATAGTGRIILDESTLNLLLGLTLEAASR